MASPEELSARLHQRLAPELKEQLAGYYDGTDEDFHRMVTDEEEDPDLFKLNPDEKCEAFRFDVVNSSTMSHGFLLGYFPQPFDTPMVLTASTEVGLKNVPALEVPVPTDRLNNHLWFQYFEYEEVEGTEKGVLTRQATGLLEFEHKTFKVGTTCVVDLFHVNTEHKGPHLLLELRCTRVPWGRPEEKAVKEANWLVRELNRPRIYHCGEAKLVNVYLGLMSDYFKKVRHTEVGLPPWDQVGESFQVGTLPLWAFLIEYGRPQRVSTSTEDSLLSMVRVCRSKEQYPRRPKDLTQADWCELLGDVMALLPLCTTYARDRRRIFDGKPVKENVFQPAGERGSLVMEDQWVHSLVCPRVKELAYDCEDGAATAFYVFHLLRSLQSQNKWLSALSSLAQRYVCCMGVGTLRMPDGPSGEHCLTYHAFPLLIDEAAFAQKLNPKPSVQATPLPTMLVETTECTSSCMDFTRGCSAETYERTRPQPALAHRKVPADIIKNSHQYQHLLLLECPQLFDKYGVVELAVESPTTGLGAPFADIMSRDFGTAPGFMLKAPVYLDKHMVEAVTTAVLQLPRTPGLPLCSEEHGHKQLLPRLSAEEGVIFFNSRYREEMVPSIVEHCRVRNIACRIFYNVPVLQDLELTYVVVSENYHPSDKVDQQKVEGHYRGRFHSCQANSNLWTYKKVLARRFPVGGQYALIKHAPNSHAGPEFHTASL